MRWVWLRCVFAVVVEQTQGAMVTGCELWRISLGRVPVVGEGKGPVGLSPGWLVVCGGRGDVLVAHAVWVRAHPSVCVDIDQWVCSLGFCAGKQ